MSVWDSFYLLEYDNRSVGEISLFSYFNDFEERSLLLKILEVAVLAIMFIISITSNVALGLCVIRYPDMKTVTNSFVLNLAAVDIVLACTIPAVGYSRLTTSWLLGNLTCKLIPYIQLVSNAVLLWTLAFISSDRYWCVIEPPYRSHLTTRRAHIYCAITWFVAITVFIPVVLWFRHHQTAQPNIFTCSIIVPKSELLINLIILGTILVLITTFILPIIILVYNYIRIFQKILSTRDTWASSCVTTSENLNTNPSTSSIRDERKPHGRRQSEVNLSEIFSPWSRRTSSSHLTSSRGRHGSLSQQEEMRINKHIKLIRIIFLNILLVLVIWTPKIVIITLICFNGSKTNEYNNNFVLSNYFLTLLFAFFNTMMNPIIYGILSDKFRAQLIKMFRSVFVRRDNIVENTVALGSRTNQHSNRSKKRTSLDNPGNIV